MCSNCHSISQLIPKGGLRGVNAGGLLPPPSFCGITLEIKYISLQFLAEIAIYA